jgi:hypothetical protein
MIKTKRVRGGAHQSEDSLQFKDAYYTSDADVKWCIEKLASLYDLDGKTALEPASGANVFPKYSPQMVWTTNELFTEFSGDAVHNYHLDFIESDHEWGRFDFVIGNPPYGRNSHLAKKFIRKALTMTDVLAMVLPNGLRRHTYWDKSLDDDIQVICEESLPYSEFILPDGKVKPVGTFFLILERTPGYSRGKLLEYEPEGYRVQETWNSKSDRAEGCWPEWATHGLSQWGSSGKFFDRSLEIAAPRCLFFDFTDEQAKLVSEIDFEPLVTRTKTTIPMVSKWEFITEINKALRSEG